MTAHGLGYRRVNVGGRYVFASSGTWGGHYLVHPQGLADARIVYRQLRGLGLDAGSARHLILKLLVTGLYLTEWVSSSKVAVPVPPREQLVGEGAGSPVVLAPSPTPSSTGSVGQR